MRVTASVSRATAGRRTISVRTDSGELETHRADEWPDASPPVAAVAGRFKQHLKEPAVHPGDVRTFGEALFEWLLGPDGWTALKSAAEAAGVDTVELALEWAADEHRLGSLPWEALHDGERFLAADPDLCVAVTRVVADAPACENPPPVPAPARVLYVIGLDVSSEDVRHGTEVIGLLRAAEQGPGAIDPRVVEQASLDKLAAACARHRPHVVHFVTHGHSQPDGRGVIDLQPTDAPPDSDPQHVTADQLVTAMSVDDALPRLVVVTGCQSGASGQHLDSLAAELVKLGVPTAIGMAGRISDFTCRLFARRFGIALNNGEALVEAVAHGRRAGLLSPKGSPGDDPSWALPSVFLAPGTTADLPLVDASRPSAVLDRVKAYDLTQDPVFCGRRRLLTLFDDLIDRRHGLQALIAYVDTSRSIGKTRMQHELASMALRAGHVVVLVDDDGNAPGLPRTARQLAIVFARKIDAARERFALGAHLQSALVDELARACGVAFPDCTTMAPDAQRRYFHGFLGECGNVDSAGTPIDPDALRNALVADLKQLISAARSASDESVGADSQAVVIVGGLDRWHDAGALLFDELLTQNGLGDDSEQVPMFGVGKLADERVNAGLRRLRSKRWARDRELRVFEGDEAVLAYKWVLLHPRTTTDMEGSQYVYTPGEIPGWESHIASVVEGVPARFDDPDFYSTAEALAKGGLLDRNDDAAALDEYAKKYAAAESATS